jgi:hypothetical protein
MARRTPDGHIVGGAEFGWVFGIDYAGPFEPDCDGNVWALFGVETGHTDMGFVELSYNKAGPDSLRGVKEMIREMHVMGPDPKPVARLHSDQDPSFNAELEAYLLTEKIAQTDTVREGIVRRIIRELRRGSVWSLWPSKLVYWRLPVGPNTMKSYGASA